MKRLTYLCLVGLVFASAAAAAPLYDIVPLGLDDLEHTRADGYKYSSAWTMNEAGQVLGTSQRYNGGSAVLGLSTWLYDGVTTIQIGLSDAEHTRNDGYKQSQGDQGYQLNAAGQAYGQSYRFNGGSADLGRSAWLYNGVTTIDIGLTGPEHTRNDGYKYSYAGLLNEPGQAHGYSERYNGGSADLGLSMWLYNGVTTIDIGLTGPEHTRNDGYKEIHARHLTQAGKVLGSSTRYNGSSTDLGTSVWLYDGVTTIDIGLTGPEHTYSIGWKKSYSGGPNEAGHIVGYSERANGGSTWLGYSAWLYNGTATIDIGLTGSEYTTNEGYKYSIAFGPNEAGQVVGYSHRYNGGSVNLGVTAWIYNGATTVNIGLTGAEYTNINGEITSYPQAFSQSGKVSGYAYRFNGSASVGKTTWIYDGTTTIATGLGGAEHTRNDGHKESFFDYNNGDDLLNEAGQVAGTSYRYNGGATESGQSTWLYDGATTIPIGLTGVEHTRNNGYKRSVTNEMNEAGQVRGRSDRYNGGNILMGSSAWLYDGETTLDIGLVGNAHTRNDGFKYSSFDLGRIVNQLNELGQVIGYSRRYNGGSTQLGQDAWLYDSTLDQTISLQLSIRSDGFAFSTATYLGEDGLVLGIYTLFDALDNNLGNRLFYFTLADGLRDLGSQVDGGISANGWDSLAGAIRANGLGQIIGHGKLTSQSGGQMAYLLTPVVPEPSTLALIAAGVVALGGYGQRRKRVCCEHQNRKTATAPIANAAVRQVTRLIA